MLLISFSVVYAVDDTNDSSFIDDVDDSFNDTNISGSVSTNFSNDSSVSVSSNADNDCSVSVSSNATDDNSSSVFTNVTDDSSVNDSDTYSTTNSSNATLKIATNFKVSNMTTYVVLNKARTGKYLNFILKDSNGIALKNKQVYVGFNGVRYDRITNSTGGAKLQINLGSKGAYTFAVCFLGDDDYSGTFSVIKITVLPLKTKLTLTNYTYKYLASKVTLKAKLTLSNGTAIANKTITFKFNNKTYTATTNSSGIATKSVSISNKKDYSYTGSFSGNNQFNKSNAAGKLKVNLKISILYWGSKGNIKKNTVLYSNLVKSSLTTAILNAAKKGTPCVMFGNGSGPVVFISSGIHGHELSSQAASIKLINTLANKTSFKGTIYVIPFVAPSMTASNIRYYNGVNLNSVANKAGSISNKVYKLAKSKNATALGDFHCSKPGGNPGKNVAMGTYSPMASSAKLAKYIASTCNVAKIIYSKAGVEYPGALEDYCSNHGITSVTCEVKTAHGTIASGTVIKSYSMMRAFLKYYGIA